METLFYWSGVALWLAVGAFVLWLLAEVAVGFVNACSYFRWSLTMMREHGRIPKWRQLPRAMLAWTWEYTGYRNTGSRTVEGKGGVWRGIGDWTVYPSAKRSKEPADERAE